LHEQLLERRGEYYKLYQMQYADNHLQNRQPAAGGAEG
jgi:hypothetical protein